MFRVLEGGEVFICIQINLFQSLRKYSLTKIYYILERTLPQPIRVAKLPIISHLFLQVRKSKHNARLSLHFDKLHVDNIIYVVNEESEEVESIDKVDEEEELEDQVRYSLINSFTVFNLKSWILMTFSLCFISHFLFH